jgi:hypothetical protein
MTPEQLDIVFNPPRETRAALPPTRKVSVILTNGQVFTGMGVLDANAKLLRLEVERVALAHLTKKPTPLAIGYESILAITDNATATPASTVPDDGQIGKTVIEAQAQGEKAAHDYQSQVQGLHRDEGGDATPASGTVELPKPV